LIYKVVKTDVSCSGKSTGRGLSGYLDMKWRHEHETGKNCIGRASRLELRTKYYRGVDKSLDRPGRKKATATKDFEFHISYL